MAYKTQYQQPMFNFMGFFLWAIASNEYSVATFNTVQEHGKELKTAVEMA